LGEFCVVCGQCKVFSDRMYTSKRHESMQSKTTTTLIHEDCHLAGDEVEL